MHEVICNWLGLPEGCWPPDHYTLLGLPSSESDNKRIEQCVHERLAKVRCYQNSHPEQATEAMNRLAQAFICLSDPVAKKAYDAGNGVRAASLQTSTDTAAPAAKINDDTVTNFRTRVDWKAVAPPVRTEAAPAAAPTAEQTAVASLSDAPAVAEAAPPAPAPALGKLEQSSGGYDVVQVIRSLEARRGLGTLPRLIDRIDATRQILWVWEKLGVFLKRKPRPWRPEEEKELTRRLTQAAELLDAFPKFLGQPGKPGYRVIAIANLNVTAHIFTSLDKEQRKALTKDWAAGRQVLLCYRRFLHREFKTLRRAGLLGRTLRAMRTAVHDHPLLILGTLVVPTALLLWFFLR